MRNTNYNKVMVFFIYQTGKNQQAYMNKEMNEKSLLHCWYECKLHNFYEGNLPICVLLVKSYKPFKIFLFGIYPIYSDIW